MRGEFGEIVEAYNDHLPLIYIFPALTSEEVAHYVALGDEAKRRIRAGDPAGAARAYREQISIFAPNPEPYVSLALLAASHGEQEAALDNMRDAVLRGFTDLGRIERSEGWTGLRRHPRFRYLQDAVPSLVRVENAWAGWDAFRASRPPETVAAALGDHEKLRVLLDLMEPALGTRYARLWQRLLDRSEAALLHVYVDERRQAEDLGAAVDRLMTLYAGSSVLRWERLPRETAARLGTVARLALERFEDGTRRSGALLCRALARYSERDGKGELPESAVAEIRSTLTEVLTRHSGSAFVTTAAAGLIRVESESGHRDRAAQAFRTFRDRHAGDTALLADLRERLGTLALEAGGLPDFCATDVEGDELQRDDLAGRVVVVDFWATWCGPCVEALPTLRTIEERYGDRVTVLGVNLDYSDEISVEELRRWIARNDVPGRQVYDGLGWESKVVEAFGVREIPFSVVVDASGQVLAVGQHGKRLKQAVLTALRER